MGESRSNKCPKTSLLQGTPAYQEIIHHDLRGGEAHQKPEKKYRNVDLYDLSNHIVHRERLARK